MKILGIISLIMFVIASNTVYGDVYDSLFCAYDSGFKGNWEKATCHMSPGKFTTIGDSRGFQIGGAGIQDAVNDYKSKIIADDEASPVQNLSIGGFDTTDTLTLMYNCVYCENSPYRYSPVTLVSIGGNDITNLYNRSYYKREVCNGICGQYMTVLEPYENINSLEELLSFVWEMEVITDQVALRTGYITTNILLANGNYKVILNDVAPILWDFYDEGWHWEYFYLVNWIIETKLNKKYEYTLVSTLQKLFGDRIQVLRTFPTFWKNIIDKDDKGSYYGLPLDGIHFSDEGKTEWKKLIAEKVVALGWYNTYPCNGGTSTPQFTYDFPSSGTFDIAAPALLGVGKKELQFLNVSEVFADGTSVDKSIYVTATNSLKSETTSIINNLDSTVTVTHKYTILLDGDVPNGSYDVDIIAKDVCNNAANFHLTYTRKFLYPFEYKGYPWYVVRITYQVN